MKAKEIISIIEAIAPLALQESFDNSGIIVGDKEQAIRGVMICLDVTMPVIEEAIMKNCNMIISHHPMLFNSIKKIVAKSEKSDLIIKAIKHDIVIYAAHTNIDSSLPGVSYILGKALGLIEMNILHQKSDFLSKISVYVPDKNAGAVREAIFKSGAGCIGNYDSCSFNSQGFGTFRGNDNSNPFVGDRNKIHIEQESKIEFVVPRYLQSKVLNALVAVHPYEEPAFDITPISNKMTTTGMGVIGSLDYNINEFEFLKKVKEIIGIQSLRHSKLRGKEIKKVAICGGSGGGFIKDAIRANADMFLTAELKHNEFIDYQNDILLADIGHYESECLIKNLIRDILIKKNSNFAILISETEENPVSYM